MVYTFSRLPAARAFADRCRGAWFVFAAPERGFLVADAREAGRLIADGIEPI
jgi:hypothetical protein